VTTPNPTQTNTDGDSQGDACDNDDDNDGIKDSSDNCSLVSNVNQANNDGDVLGDACDPDDDNDGVGDGPDICEGTPTHTKVDPANGCGIAQLCPCSGPRGQTVEWASHGAYVKCVANSLDHFEDLRLISKLHQLAGTLLATISKCGDSPRDKCWKKGSKHDKNHKSECRDDNDYWHNHDHGMHNHCRR
jgi:hypothetical protein